MLHILLFAVCISSHLFGDDAVIFHATSNDFYKVESSVQPAIVMFYASWCGHCKKMAPEMGEASKELNGKVILAAVNCEDERDICSKYGVQGYPTVKVFKAQSKYGSRASTDYSGAREAKPLIEYSYSLLNDNIKRYNREQDGINVVFFTKKKTTLMKAISTAFPSYKMFEVNKGHEIAEEFGVAKFPTLSVIKNGKRQDYSGDFNFVDLSDFLKTVGTDEDILNFERYETHLYYSRHEVLPEADIDWSMEHPLNNDQFQSYCSQNKCMIAILADDVYDEDKERIKLIEQLADENNKTRFVYFTCFEQRNLCEALNFIYNTPMMICYYPYKNGYVTHVGSFNKEGINSFIMSVSTGRVTNFVNLPDLQFPYLNDCVDNPPVREEIVDDDFDWVPPGRVEHEM